MRVIRELDENSPRANDVDGAKIQLKPHQLSLLHACRGFEDGLVQLSDDAEEYMQSRLGVIGDKVGAGKSYVILSLMLSPLPAKYQGTKDTLSYAMNTVQVHRRHRKRLVRASLLVVPHNLIRQWQEYIENFVPTGTRTLTIGRARVLETIDDVDNYDLVLTTNTFYPSVARVSDDVRWRRVVFDEVDSIKIVNCGFVDACTYWFVTASYNNVLNPLGRTVLDRATSRYVQLASGLRMTGFVRSLFQELQKALEPPHTLAAVVMKNSDRFVDASANLPPIIDNIVRCCQSREINILNGIVDHHIIQHLNANDVRGAMSFISASKRQTEDNIINCLIESMDKKARNITVKIEYHRTLEYDDDAVREAEISRLQVKRGEIQGRIKAIQERITSSGTCPICYDDIEQKCILPCCQNAFCIRCITRWLSLNTKCPLCKGHSSMKDMYVVSSESGGASMVVDRPKSKIENLSVLLKKIKEDSNKRKVIIFSSYDSTFDAIIPMLTEHDMGYECLHGTGAHVALMTKRYREHELNVLLANAGNFGSGLNLEVTTDVIMFHKFDSEVERQVIGRAQRPGRTCQLNVWYLLNENEISLGVSPPNPPTVGLLPPRPPAQ